jgi:hypothetical protein
LGQSLECRDLFMHIINILSTNFQS